MLSYSAVLSSFILSAEGVSRRLNVNSYGRRNGMGRNDKAQALAAYLQALAILQRTDRTIVKREIAKVMQEIEKELGLKTD